MHRALLAGTAYFVSLFALGFALGAMRVLLLAPNVGPFAATLIEAPLMLIAAWFLCRWAIRGWKAPGSYAARWAMALWFFALLAAFETALGAALFGRSPAQQLADLLTPAGLLGLTLQIVAALFPLFVDRKNLAAPESKNNQ